MHCRLVRPWPLPRCYFKPRTDDDDDDPYQMPYAIYSAWLAIYGHCCLPCDRSVMVLTRKQTATLFSAYLLLQCTRMPCTSHEVLLRAYVTGGTIMCYEPLQEVEYRLRQFYDLKRPFTSYYSDVSKFGTDRRQNA